MGRIRGAAAPLWAGCLLLAALLPARADDAPAAVTADGGRYFGALVDGRRQGEGRIEWDNGALYEGGFDNGLFSGHGRLRYPTGDVYEGDFAAGMQAGQGKMAFHTGATYEGGFRNDTFEGPGRYDDGNGSVFEGNYKDGRLEGHGRLTEAEAQYEGEFHLGKPSGEGEIRYRDGRVYRGAFQRGRYEGKGRLEMPGGAVYEGDFVAGVFTGHGVVAAPGGRRQEGEFRDWKAEGEGVLDDGRGTRYEGQFHAGELGGKGRIIAKDGSRYEGEIKRWVPYGEGELRRANGDVYRGHFEYGLYEGQGTLTYGTPQADGRTQDTGLWRYGRLKKAEEDESRLARANVEAALYGQPALLDGAVAALAPRKGGSINLYLLGVAGEGSQEVFRREAEFVRGQFDAEYGTRGHSLVLVNSRSTVASAPMATVTSIRKALGAMAAAMDREQDILFLYITSHGSRDREISLGLPGMELPPLSAHDLGAALKDSGIRWKVVVISACYAGGFIDELRDPDTLILTAARHDRRSFGCADENEFTYFGRAFFKEALPQSVSFEDAFSRADRLIAQWEDRDAQKERITQAAGQDAEDGADPGGAQATEEDRHSLPQMDDPPAIRDHLRRWREQLGAARANGDSAQNSR